MAAVLSSFSHDTLCDPFPSYHQAWPSSPYLSCKSAQSVPIVSETALTRRPSIFSVHSEGFLSLGYENKPSLLTVVDRNHSAVSLGNPSVEQTKQSPKRNSSPLSARSNSVHPFRVKHEIRNTPASSFGNSSEAIQSIKTSSQQQAVVPSLEVLQSSLVSLAPPTESSVDTQYAAQPFKKWVTSLRRRHLRRRRTLPGLAQAVETQFQIPTHARSRSSSSFSSSAFLTRVLTATYSQASPSLPPSSRLNGGSRRLRSNTRTSGLSGSDYRRSTDSTNAPLDPLVIERAGKRRSIIDEIYSTEEAYLIDLKVFENVYFTMLPTGSMLSASTRQVLHRLVTDLIQLHESILEELRLAIEHGRPPTLDCHNQSNRHHTRWRSIDAVRETSSVDLSTIISRGPVDRFRGFERPAPRKLASPRMAAEIAGIYGRKIQSFAVYEGYAAHYQSLRESIDTQEHKESAKGVERYRWLYGPDIRFAHQDRFASTPPDLAIKPIQRLLRYPMLFAELRKATPVFDDPVSYGAIEKVEFRYGERAKQVNRSEGEETDTRDRMEKTWILQDRIKVFEQPDHIKVASFRMLGHVILCGALHVAWEQTPNCVQGDYLACILFPSTLLLASVKPSSVDLHLQASIALTNAHIEDCDKGEGLYSLAAPYSFKLAFQANQQLYEMIFTASSATEEHTWRTSLSERILSENDGALRGGPVVQEFLAPLMLAIEPVGSVYGHGKVLSRRTSLGRVSSSGSRSPSKFRQVIIRNNFDSDCSSMLTPLALNRTRSMVNTERLHVLTPRQSDRVVLEGALSDIWTRDRLPLLSRTYAKGHHHGPRRSASKMMKKLSLPLLSTTIHRRSSSHVSLKVLTKDSCPSSSKKPANNRAWSSATLDGAADSPRHERRLAVITSETEGSPSGDVPPSLRGLDGAESVKSGRGFSLRRSSKRVTLEEMLHEKRPSLVRQRTANSMETDVAIISSEPSSQPLHRTETIGRRGLRNRLRGFTPLMMARRALDRG